MSSHPHIDFEKLPALRNDPAYWGMTVTQFLGALNDTIFKQLVLLLCLGVMVAGSVGPQDMQFLAQAIFSIPFVLFSGISGWWSDRMTKRSLIIGCKVLEIVVMAAAVATFAWMAAPSVTLPAGAEDDPLYLMQGVPWVLFAVLFLMGTQSTIFGPAKYGILPEMVRAKDLPRFNGMIQMTTFVALVVGVPIGGFLLDHLHDSLWLASLVCVGIAVLGTATSFLVRKTPIAQPGAPFSLAALAADKETFQLLKRDKPLRRALAAYSLFWFVAAVLPMGLNWLGKYQFHLSYGKTSMLLATSSIGIAAGFVLGGYLSQGKVRFGLVRLGTWGLFCTLLLISCPSSFSPTATADVQQQTGAQTTDAALGDALAPGEPTAEAAVVDPKSNQQLAEDAWPHLLGPVGSPFVLVLMGFFAGLFALPVQVFLQSRPPEHLKGRMIGTMNLINWIAIILSAVYYMVGTDLIAWLGLPKFLIFAVTGLLLLPLALFYRPADVSLSSEPTASPSAMRTPQGQLPPHRP